MGRCMEWSIEFYKATTVRLQLAPVTSDLTKVEQGTLCLNCWFFKFCINMPRLKGDSSKRKNQNRTQNSEPKVLLVRCPENVLKIKDVSIRKLWHELFAPRSYMVKRTYETLYLQISDLHIRGRGYVHFNPNLPNAGDNRQRKCMRINNQLYVPLPIGFEGILQQTQYLGFLKIFPPTCSVVNLINYVETTTSTSSGVYNSSGFEMINCRRL